jgi:hypothetical protein
VAATVWASRATSSLGRRAWWRWRIPLVMAVVYSYPHSPAVLDNIVRRLRLYPHDSNTGSHYRVPYEHSIRVYAVSYDVEHYYSARECLLQKISARLLLELRRR